MGVMDTTRVLGGVSLFKGSTLGGDEVKESKVGLSTLVEPATEGEPLVITRPEGTEILRLLTLADSEGVVDTLLAGGTGVALADLGGMFLMVVLPLALEDALGFEVMVNLNEQSGFAGLQDIVYNLNKIKSIQVLV